jgi:hypothetical protein
MKKKIILAVILVAIMAGVGVAVTVKADKEYQANMENAVFLMMVGGVTTETAVNTVQNVWYDTIFNDRVYINGKVYTDFNDTIVAQREAFELDGTYKKIKDNRASVDNALYKLKSPSARNKEQYDAIIAIYTDYEAFTEMALNPTGSLTSYSSAIIEKDNDFSSKVKSYNMKYKTSLDK